MVQAKINGQDVQVEDGSSIADACDHGGIKAVRQAVAARVDGRVVDLTQTLRDGAEVELIAAESDEGLVVIRHSCAHVMAEAVTKLFPQAQPTIGPVVGDRFYYDFDTNRTERPISTDDFEAIEQEMAQIIKEKRPFLRRELDADAARREAEQQGNPYKVENVDAAVAAGADSISLYRQGTDEVHFEDVCRGPHVPNTGCIGAFKLLSIAGTTWHGEVDGAPLQRLYGTAWHGRKELKQYLQRLEEARKRDHRRLGPELELLHFEPEIAPGQVFYLPKGQQILVEMRSFLRSVLEHHGYTEVNTPLFMDRRLWETSGHWQKFRDKMFTLEWDKREFAVKPMNCPGHCLIYKRDVRSYRDLPIRMAEFGHVHRNEQHGEIHGVLRTRGFVQDDAHIFCAQEQLQDEIVNCMQQVRLIYSAFGFDTVRVELSTRPETFIGSEEAWERSEKALAAALESEGVDYKLNPGDGAFYGPKIDFHLTDSIGRSWQVGTVQVDFNLPERFDLEYITTENTRARPVMIHRALLGSFERFFGIMIEEFAGAFPLWLAPVQMRVAGIADRHHERVSEVVEALRAKGVRAEADLSSEKVGAKKAAWRQARIPLFGVIGDNEMESGQVAVTGRGNRNLGTMDTDTLVEMIRQDVSDKTR